MFPICIALAVAAGCATALVIGADGYRALISYGEMAPGLGERAVLLATAEDGLPLARPRLVVPGDAKGSRSVTDAVEPRVPRP